jgi:hypothetical protein
LPLLWENIRDAQVGTAPCRKARGVDAAADFQAQGETHSKKEMKLILLVLVGALLFIVWAAAQLILPFFGV